MEKVFQNKLKTFVVRCGNFIKKRSSAAKIKAISLFNKAKMLAVRASSFIKTISRRVMSVFFESVHGVWLSRPWASLLGYGLLFIFSFSVILILDLVDCTRQFIHSDDANEAVIGLITILLALFIPVAIALIEDARESALARQTIVKSIIRFSFAPLVLLVVCIFFFIPEGIHIFGESVTLKNSYAAILVCCVLFILTSLRRSYKWLSDGSTYSSGSPQTPPEGDPQPEAFVSYRFARIVRLLSSTKRYETWMTIWSQWFPGEYENVLHASFFKREFAVLKNKKIKRYIVLSLELEAYDKYFKKRNISDWWFELEYAKQFLFLYADTEGVIDADRTTARTMGLWRGKSALERINNKILEAMMTRERVWNLFEFMGEYVEKRGLLKVKEGKGLQNDILVKRFLESYFNAVTKDKLSTYGLESYFAPDKPWAVTHDNLYNNRYNLSFIVADEFKEWLFTLLDNMKKSDNRAFEVDSLLADLFPQTDPIDMGELFWMLYQAKNTTDSKLIVELNYKEERPIGHIGRSTSFWAEEEDVRMRNFAKFQSKQEDDAVKLFATMYATYFRSFWNLDEIIETAKAVDLSILDKREASRLSSFIRLNEKIKKFYNQIDAESKKKTKE